MGGFSNVLEALVSEMVRFRIDLQKEVFFRGLLFFIVFCVLCAYLQRGFAAQSKSTVFSNKSTARPPRSHKA